MAQSQTNLNINGKNQLNAGEKPITHQIQLMPIEHAPQHQIQPPHPQQKRGEQELIGQVQQIPWNKEILISKIDPSSQNLNPESLIKVEKNITIQQIQPIFYQIPNSNTNRQLKKQCQFCAQFLEEDNFEKAFTCMHIYCKSCLNTYIQIQFKNYRIIYCPQTSCKALIDQNANYFQGFSQQKKEKYNVIKFRKNIQQNPNLVLCPDQKCTKGFIQIKTGDKTGQCKQCNIVYCLNCKVKNHSGKCQNFEQILLKDKFKYKRCYGCKRVVERNQGCPHMTCKCGSQFCYYCGEKWVSPHRCIRYLAGGTLITDRLNTCLKCLRHEDFEYQYNILGFLMRVPYYIVSFLLMTLYICWTLILCILLIVLIITGSSISGYFAIQYKLYKAGSQISKIVFILLIILFPIGFLIGWIGLIGALFINIFPKFAELTLSGRLVPCLIN